MKPGLGEEGERDESCCKELCEGRGARKDTWGAVNWEGRLELVLGGKEKRNEKRKKGKQGQARKKENKKREEGETKRPESTRGRLPQQQPNEPSFNRKEGRSTTPQQGPRFTGLEEGG